MMPPIAPPAPSPVPAAPSDAGSSPKDGRDAAHPPVSFDALLALLAGTGPAAASAAMPLPAPAPATPAHSGKDPDGTGTADDAATGSVEALVAVLAQQLSGTAPTASPPVRPAAGEAGGGQPPAPAPAVTSPPVPSAGGAPLPATAPATTEPDPEPATDARPGHGSAVAALAHSGDRPGSPSPVAALAHSGDGSGSPSPVAALAHGDRNGDPGPPTTLPSGTTPPPQAGPVTRPHNDESGAVPETDPATAAAVPPSEGVSAASTAPAPEPRRPSAPAVSADPAGPLPAPAAAPAAAVEAPAITPTSDTAPATPAAVADQIVSAVVPLHGRGDGRHEVTLELRPESLGTIRVELSVEHQTVHLTLHAAEPSTGGLLAAALPDLRTALADAGLTAGHIGLGPDGGHGPGQQRPSAGEGGNARGRQPDPEPSQPARLARPAPAGRLDVLL